MEINISSYTPPKPLTGDAKIIADQKALIDQRERQILSLVELSEVVYKKEIADLKDQLGTSWAQQTVSDERYEELEAKSKALLKALISIHGISRHMVSETKALADAIWLAEQIETTARWAIYGAEESVE